jgi:hypothetical protein
LIFTLYYRRKRKMRLGLLPVLLVACPTAFADVRHAEYDAIMEVVDTLFLAINTSDAELTKSIVTPDSMNYVVSPDGQGGWQHKSVPQSFYTDQTNYGPEKVTERYWSPTLLIDEAIAVFWAPYDFYIDGKFSHCGIDAFDLIKVGDEWKVGNASYTRRTTGCELHPDGPPSEARE